jgi:hypothetical protein
MTITAHLYNFRILRLSPRQPFSARFSAVACFTLRRLGTPAITAACWTLKFLEPEPFLHQPTAKSCRRRYSAAAATIRCAVLKLTPVALAAALIDAPSLHADWVDELLAKGRQP